MPDIVTVLTDPFSVALFVLYGALWAAESLWPARELPTIPWARTRGVVAFGAFFMLSTYLPFFWADALAAHRLIDLSSLGVAGGAAAGIAAYELVAYGYHRALHGSSLLWRQVHQMHHSSERLDIPSAFLFHPLDMVGWTVVTSFGLVGIVGITPVATGVALLVINFAALLGHANLKTPRWLGYLIARPENHALHHARGRHRSNYADFSVVDMLFGTFENPATFPTATGFADGASGRLRDLLIGRDLSTSGRPVATVDAPSEDPATIGAFEDPVPSSPMPSSR